MSKAKGVKKTWKEDRLLVRFASSAVIALLSTCVVIQPWYHHGNFWAPKMAVLDSATKGAAKSPSVKTNEPPEGCLPSDTQDQHLNRSLPVLRTEEELMTSRPRNFHRMPGFDNEDGMVFEGFLGGIVDLRDAYVLSKYQISYNCDIVYVPHGCKVQNISDEEIFSLIASPINAIKNASFSETRIEKLDTVVNIAQFWGYAYYHAMIEDLPRLALALDMLDSDPKAAILSYPESLMYPTSRPLLLNKLMGLGDDRKWVSFDDNTVYFVKRLLVPTVTRCGNGQPKALRLVRDRIVANTPLVLKETLEQFWLQYPETRAGQKMIIIVQKRTNRSLLNHDDLLHALKAVFANCCRVIEFLGTEPLEEYIVMHQQAKVIVGPHGAGLANALFAPPSAALVEIHPKVGNFNGTQVNKCHQWTAKSLGLESRILLQASEEPFGSSFTVDVGSVIDTVRELLRDTNL